VYQCLNNHDFGSVPCSLLRSCLSTLGARGTFPYESLVTCTGAKAMPLSVFPTYDSKGRQLLVKPYLISQTCWGLSIPLHFSRNECASTFAVSSACNIAGASLGW
jgi:hypothetical protein